MPSHSAVTPSDTQALSAPSRYFYVGIAGDIKAKGVRPDDAAVVFKSVAAGPWNCPWPIGQIFATGTTATNILIHAEGNPSRGLGATSPF